MASVTRSTRRAELPTYHPQSPPYLVATHTRAQQLLHQNHPSKSGTGRTKRPLDAQDCDFDAFKPKRARIAVEILAKQHFHQQSRSDNPLPHPRGHAPKPQQSPHPSQAAPVAGAAVAKPVPPPAAAATRPPPQPSQQKPTNPPSVATATGSVDAHSRSTHQEKVVNGIKHELSRLQPGKNALPVPEQGRKLRSQEATRFKSELSAYFPDYDEVIGNDPKEQHLLNLDTPIIVVNPAGPDSKLHIPPISTVSEDSGGLSSDRKCPVRGYSDSLFSDLCDSQRIDFGFLETRYKGKTLDDPLPDSYFEPAHKKAERLERSIRNSEKGRAQHEKDQIIRLLEGLQGPDWLRTMGVSGITESRKKTFEPARRHFIKGCLAILEKFRTWALEEKRLKQEKERALAAKAQAEEGDDEKEAGEEGSSAADEGDVEESLATRKPEGDTRENLHGEGDEDDQDDRTKDRSHEAGESDPFECSDVDASIAKQLREEAMARSKQIAAKKRTKQAGHALSVVAPVSVPVAEKEFTSFFEKRYQRDAALNQNRRKGRTVLAWGHQVPDGPTMDFALPDEYLVDDTLKLHARRKRRDRRGH